MDDTLLAAAAGIQVGAALTAMIFVWRDLQTDWSLHRRRLQAPSIGFAGGASGLLLALAGFEPLWPSWAVLGVTAAMFVGLPAVRGCDWAGAWQVLRAKAGRS